MSVVTPTTLLRALLCAAALAAPAVRAQVAAAAQPRFDVFELRVEGNSLLPDAEIERSVAAGLGEARTLRDIEAARAALEQRYRDAGYQTVVVAIPEQQVDGGVVTLQVTEAPVGRVRVVGAEFHLPSVIRGKLAALAEGQVPDFNRLQVALAQVNRSADLKVAPVLKPGRIPGTVDVQLDVEDQLPLHGNVELSNRQAMNTTAARLSGSLRYDNLFQAGHSLGLSATTTPQALEQTRVLSANYLVPLDAAGDALSVYMMQSRSKFATLFNAPGLGLLGNSNYLGLRVTRPLAARPGMVQTASFGLDRKQVEQTLQLNGVGAPSPAVTYVPLVASWRAVWTEHQPLPSSLDINLILGVRGLMGNSDAAFNARRAGASAGFAAARASLQWSESFGRWVGTMRTDLQLASGPLLPSEQYVAGGLDTVRGYYEAERSADGALRAGLELLSPVVRPAGVSLAWAPRAVLFAEGVRLSVQQPAAGQLAHPRLASVGLGLRVAGPRGVNLQLDLARPLVDGDPAGGGTRAGTPRLHGRMGLEF